MIYFYTKFHMPASNGPIVITIKPKLNANVHTVARLFYILQKNYLIKSWIFFEDLLPHSILGP
jgi:hypothetical protein